MNADIMIENAEPASCKTMRAEAEIKRDRFAQQLAAWECLRFFENTPVVEVDFQGALSRCPTMMSRCSRPSTISKPTPSC